MHRLSYRAHDIRNTKNVSINEGNEISLLLPIKYAQFNKTDWKLMSVFLSFPKLLETFQSYEAQGAEKLVQADLERPSLSPHQDPSHHPQRPEM